MRELREAMTGAIYGLDGSGVVRVELDGRTGWFDAQGRWLRGDVRVAVPHLCLWIAGPALPEGTVDPRRAVMQKAAARPVEPPTNSERTPFT